MSITQEIINSIKRENFTIEELNEISRTLVFVRSQLAKKNKTAFVKGTQVKFVATKTNTVVTGQVVAVKRKYIHVRSGYVTYSVPAEMLVAL